MANGSNLATILNEINSTLKSMDSRASRAAQRSEPGFDVGHAGLRSSQAAGGLLGLAAAATGPSITGSLYANARSLLGEIGMNETLINQASRLSSILRDLKDAWRNLTPEVQAYSINSTIAVAGVGAAVSAFSRMGPALGQLSQMQMGGGATFGDFGRQIGNLAMTPLGRIGVGAGVAGIGSGINSLLGRNLVGDALVVGGLSHASYGIGTGLQQSAMDLRRSGQLSAGAARNLYNAGSFIGPIGTAATVTTMFGPQVAGDINSAAYTGNMGQGTRTEQALREHESSFTIFQDESGRRASLRGMGYSDEQVNSALDRAGIGHGWSLGGLFGRGFGSSNLGTSQLRSLSQELVNPGSSDDPSTGLRGERSQILASLNFQSRQFGIDQMHDVIQQQAVMDPAQRNERQQNLEALERNTIALDRASNGGRPSVGLDFNGNWLNPGVSTSGLQQAISDLWTSLTSF